MDSEKTVVNEEELNEVSGGIVMPGGRVVQYTVVKGDTLGRLAQKYRTTIEVIMAMNPIIKNRNLIRIGWVLTIPDNR